MTDQEALIKKFPRLAGGEVIERKREPSFNDGGHNVTYIWEVIKRGKTKHYRTVYNTWAVDHPETTCHEVKKVIVTKEVWRPV